MYKNSLHLKVSVFLIFTLLGLSCGKKQQSAEEMKSEESIDIQQEVQTKEEANVSFAPSEPSQFSYTIDTKGTPFKGEITSRDGNIVAILKFFGEGTDKIYFDQYQALILKDDNGNYIAGFEAEATKPSTHKVTQVYDYQYEERGKKKRLVFEHGVAKVECRKGKFSVTDPDKIVLTSYFIGDTKLTVLFGSIRQFKSNRGQLKNRLLLTSEEGDEFQFDIIPSSSMLHSISKVKGNIVEYLKKKEQKLTKTIK